MHGRSNARGQMRGLVLRLELCSSRRRRQQRSPHAAPVGRELEERGDAHLRQRGAQVSRESGVVLKQA